MTLKDFFALVGAVGSFVVFCVVLFLAWFCYEQRRAEKLAAGIRSRGMNK